jgi:hypothetical protein
MSRRLTRRMYWPWCERGRRCGQPRAKHESVSGNERGGSTKLTYTRGIEQIQTTIPKEVMGWEASNLEITGELYFSYIAASLCCVS